MSKFEIPVEPLETWSEFTEFLAREVWKEAPPQRGQYLFRGQADADWHLISSFDRAISQSSSLNPDLEDRVSRGSPSKGVHEESDIHRKEQQDAIRGYLGGCAVR